MKNTFFNKNITIYLLIGLLVAVGFVGSVSAKYIHDAGEKKKLIRTKEFYFTSNLLTEEGKDYYLNADSDGVKFTLGNNADELRFSEDNIEYEVTISFVDGDNDESFSLSIGDADYESSLAILTAQENNATVHELTLSGLDKDTTYIVTAVGKSICINPDTGIKTVGYEKTLTATFQLANDDEAVYKYLEKYDEYVLLTVWAENIQGNLSFEYTVADGQMNLIPDNTDPMMKGVSNYNEDNYGTIKFTDEHSFEEKYSSYTYRFFIDKNGTLSVEDFTIELNNHIASPAEPK